MFTISAKQAWGYISPSDEVIVTNEGDLFVKIERANLTIQNGKDRRLVYPLL